MEIMKNTVILDLDEYKKYLERDKKLKGFLEEAKSFEKNTLVIYRRDGIGVKREEVLHFEDRDLALELKNLQDELDSDFVSKDHYNETIERKDNQYNRLLDTLNDLQRDFSNKVEECNRLRSYRARIAWAAVIFLVLLIASLAT